VEVRNEKRDGKGFGEVSNVPTFFVGNPVARSLAVVEGRKPLFDGRIFVALKWTFGSRKKAYLELHLVHLI
jgi:hypothetical protein